MTRQPRGATFLPDYLLPGHNLCLLNHDILVELLRSGAQQGAFSQTFKFRDEDDGLAFHESTDIFDWFARTGRTEETKQLLRRTVFPALLSDFLHFVFEALETSRKAKLNVTYALIRKPLQESLFLLEVISTDLDAFAQHLVENPMQLRAQKAGGVEAHARRIAKALAVLGEEHRFDATYLAQLRYDRSAEDGFDGICNKAVHLFTEHAAIRTEPMNVNFIFSGPQAKLTQWYYLYSRLPYVLFYARRLVEHVCASFAGTEPTYLADMDRRVMAGTLLWERDIPTDYKHAAINRFVNATRTDLASECRAVGYRAPSMGDLVRMRRSGAYPGEIEVRVRLRGARYSATALARRIGHVLHGRGPP